MLATKTKKTRETRFSIRATTEQKEIITKAAARENKNISDFVLENALFAAEAVVGDDANFALTGERWDAFCAALDASPRQIPALRELLTGKSVFDGGE